MYETEYINNEPRKCGLTVIPEDHFGESWYYNSSTYKSQLYDTGGNGISDTDLVVYVTYSNTSCGETTLAWAMPCILDQFGRPVAGTINFCPRVIGDGEEQYWKVHMLIICLLTKVRKM